MTDEVEDSPLFRRRWFAWLAVGILALAGAVYFVWPLVWRTWARARDAALDKQVAAATESFQRGEYSNTSEILQGVLKSKSEHLGAARAMANLAKELGSARQLEWLQRAFSLPDSDISDAMRLATYYREIGDFRSGDQVLVVASKRGAPTGALLDLRGDFALMRGDFPAARSLYEEALREDPSSEIEEAKILAVDLVSTDRGREAGSRLEQLATDGSPRSRVTAGKILAGYGVAKEDRAAVIRWAKMVRDTPEATLEDRMEGFQCLRKVRAESDLYFALLDLKAFARKNDKDALTLARWLNANGLPLDAVEFRFDLEDATVKKMPFSLVIASSLALLQDDRALLAWANDATWEGLEFFPSFLKAHCANPTAGGLEQERLRYFSAAARMQGGVELLATLTDAWGWNDDFQWIVWRQIESTTDPDRWIWSMARHATRNNNPALLHKVLTRGHALRPEDKEIAHDYARIGLLLSDPSRMADRIASDLYKANYQDGNIACTKALSLCALGMPEEAIKVLDALPEDARITVGVRLYRAVALGMAGRKEEAAAQADGLNSGDFLPLEWDWLQRALQAKGSSSERSTSSTSPTSFKDMEGE